MSYVYIGELCTNPFFLQVINAYAYLCKVENDSTSVLTTFEARKLTGKNASRECTDRTKWAHHIAKKCEGRHLV